MSLTEVSLNIPTDHMANVFGQFDVYIKKIEVVSEHFQISLDQMISKNRSKDIARPRQIAMYLCKNMTDTPLDSIGALLGGRDHSTIIHGVQKISDEYESDETTRSIIDTIKKKINPN